MVFTTRLSGGKGGRNALEHELRRLGITQKNGKPNHPQTQGKVERFQQTMKNWLRALPSEWPMTCYFSVPRRVKPAFCPPRVREFRVAQVSVPRPG